MKTIDSPKPRIDTGMNHPSQRLLDGNFNTVEAIKTTVRTGGKIDYYKESTLLILRAYRELYEELRDAD